MGLPLLSISSICELCDKWESGRSHDEKEEGLKWEPELVLGFIEPCVAYTTPVSFLYVHSIGEHDQHKKLNLELGTVLSET